MPTLKFRRGTTSQWASQTKDILAGEPALNTETGELKVGDGTNTLWANLKPYIASLLIKDDGSTVSIDKATTVLGSVAGDVVDIFKLAFRMAGNATGYLRYRYQRHTDGSAETSANLRMSLLSGSTERGWLEFGSRADDSTQSVGFGHAGARAMSVQTDGALKIHAAKQVYLRNTALDVTGVNNTSPSTQLIEYNLAGLTGNMSTMVAAGTTYFAPFKYTINTDVVDASDLNAGVVGWWFSHKFGSGASSGTREAMKVDLTLTAPTQNATLGWGGSKFSVFHPTFRVSSSDGGTAESPRGQIVCDNPQIIVDAGVNYLDTVEGHEMNLVFKEPGMVCKNRLGYTVNVQDENVARAYRNDCAFSMSLGMHQIGAPVSVGFLEGYTVGHFDGQWPIDPTEGTLFRAIKQALFGNNSAQNPCAASRGIDIADVAFVNEAYRSTNCAIHSKGEVAARAIRVTGYDPLCQYPAIGSTFDLDFIRDFGWKTGGSITTSTGLGTFTRAGSVGTYMNEAGVIVSSSADTPRFTFDPWTLQPAGLRMEGSRQNLLLNTDALATQDVTVTAAEHTLSFYGTGTVVLSGAHAATIVYVQPEREWRKGTYPMRSVYTFTPTAGTLTVTVTGTVQFAQLELGAAASTYIPNTGTAQTRSADKLEFSGANFSDWFNASTGTFFFEFEPSRLTSDGTWLLFSTDNTACKSSNISGSNLMRVNWGTSGVTDTVAGNVQPGKINRLAFGYDSGALQCYSNGVKGTTDNAFTLLTPTILSLAANRATANQEGFMRVRRVAFWPTKLDNWKLQQMTDR